MPAVPRPVACDVVSSKAGWQRVIFAEASVCAEKRRKSGERRKSTAWYWPTTQDQWEAWRHQVRTTKGIPVEAKIMTVTEVPAENRIPVVREVVTEAVRSVATPVAQEDSDEVLDFELANEASAWRWPKTTASLQCMESTPTGSEARSATSCVCVVEAGPKAFKAELERETSTWSADRAVPTAIGECLLRTIARYARGGVLIVHAPTEDLNDLQMQSSDNGCLERQLNRRGARHVVHQGAEFTEMMAEWSDSSGGTAQEGCWIVSANGEIRAAAIEIQPPPAPFIWSSADKRQSRAFALAHSLRRGLVYVMSETGLLHMISAGGARHGLVYSAAPRSRATATGALVVPAASGASVPCQHCGEQLGSIAHLCQHVEEQHPDRILDASYPDFMHKLRRQLAA